MSFLIKKYDNLTYKFDVIYQDIEAEKILDKVCEDLSETAMVMLSQGKYTDIYGTSYRDLLFTEVDIRYATSLSKIDDKGSRIYQQVLRMGDVEISFYTPSFSAFLCKVNRALSENEHNGFCTIIGEGKPGKYECWVLSTDIVNEIRAVLVANFDEFIRKENEFFERETPILGSSPANPKASAA